MKARARGDKRIIFTGFVFGQDYRALQQNAYCYVHATEVGGTHPALLEAMGYGNCVLTLATPENIEVVGDAGVPYIDEFDLAEKLQRVLRDGSLVQAYRNRAQQRIQTHYDWETVVDQYEQLFARMSGQTAPTTATNRRTPRQPKNSKSAREIVSRLKREGPRQFVGTGEAKRYGQGRVKSGWLSKHENRQNCNDSFGRRVSG